MKVTFVFCRLCPCFEWIVIVFQYYHYIQDFIPENKHKNYYGRSMFYPKLSPFSFVVEAIPGFVSVDLSPRTANQQ
jgi:hypothetical protein